MKSIEMGPDTNEKKVKKFFRITPEQFDSLPNGTKLRRWAYIDRTNEILIKGKDEIPTDTHAGFMALGFFEEDLPHGMQVDEKGMSIKDNDDTDN